MHFMTLILAFPSKRACSVRGPLETGKDEGHQDED